MKVLTALHSKTAVRCVLKQEKYVARVVLFGAR